MDSSAGRQVAQGLSNLPYRLTFYFTSSGEGGPEAGIPHNACNRHGSLDAVLSQPLEILLDRLAEVGGQLTADLLQDFLALLGRQIAPAVTLTDVFGIDLTGAFQLGPLAVLHGAVG